MMISSPQRRAALGLLTSLVLAASGCSAPSHTARPASNAVEAASSSAAVGPRSTPLATDWPTYHHDGIRSGYSSTVRSVQSGLTRVWNVALDGAVYASPIVANGYKVVVTENNTLYRIQSNRVVWSRHLGAPVPRSALPCGNIDPSGITGTPAYDPATSTIVAVAVLNNPIRHIAVGIDPRTGVQRWFRNVDVPASVPGITPRAMQQRGALLVSGRRVYVPYGGLAGDCSSYRGSVVGLDLDHPTSARLWNFTVPTSREAGIWTPPGPSENPGGGLLVAVGNGATAETGTYDYSDSVLKLAFERIQDSFSPSTWRTDNRDDLDLGSQGPTIVGSWVFIAGKSGTAYVLRRAALGGIGGEVRSAPLCRSFGGTAVSGSTVYVPCTDGLRAVRINGDGSLTVLWHAAAQLTGSPVLGGGRLWSLDTSNGVLYALDPATGADRGHVSVGAVSRFATPALWVNSVLVPTLAGVVAYNWT